MTRTSIDIDIDASTQYATAYRDGKPVATFQRKRVLAPKGEPLWKCYGLDGTLLFNVYLPYTSTALANRLARYLDKQ